MQVRPRRARPWDLVRVQAQTWAMAHTWAMGPREDALTEVTEQAKQLASMWAMAVRVALQTEETAKVELLAWMWAQEQARQLSWAWARAWAAGRTQSATALDGLGLELGQVRAWLRVWTLEKAQEQSRKASWEQKERKSRKQRSQYFSWLKFHNDFAWPGREQGYWWLTQIITPIARLPSELLQQIFLIVTDNDNDSPLVLMRVCKYWFDIVTGIWGSLKLGTTTPMDAVIAKLERVQWLLDVLVDTEIDRHYLYLPPLPRLLSEPIFGGHYIPLYDHAQSSGYYPSYAPAPPRAYTPSYYMPRTLLTGLFSLPCG